MNKQVLISLGVLIVQITTNSVFAPFIVQPTESSSGRQAQSRPKGSKFGSLGYVIRFGLVLCFFTAADVAQTRAEVFGDIEFPQGMASFADMVVSYEPLFDGGPEPKHARFIDPDSALGPPDYSGGDRGTGSVSLGNGGRITLRFTDNLLTGSGSNTPDLHIFEIGPAVEDTFVEISKEGTTWFAIGKVFGGTSNIDIDAFGFGLADQFAFVRLRDDPSEGLNEGETVGADIDAVGAISTTIVPEPSTLLLTVFGCLVVPFITRQRRILHNI